jgi:hypothetical protein
MIDVFPDTNRTFYQNDTDNSGFFFMPFTCTYDPVCCTDIFYAFSSSNTTGLNYTQSSNFTSVQLNPSANMTNMTYFANVSVS